MRFLGYRILTGVLSTGVIGPEASISKLYWSEYHRDVTRLAVDVLGAQALVVEGRRPLRSYRADDPGAPNSTASWVGALYNGVADTIYAGTSEVQRNILAENVLGLPKEPRGLAELGDHRRVPVDARKRRRGVVPAGAVRAHAARVRRRGRDSRPTWLGRRRRTRPS